MATTEMTRPQAAEVTTEQWEALVEEAQEAHKALLETLQAERGLTWLLANRLYNAAECYVWTRLGYETQEAYLGSPEIGIPRDMFFKLITAWQVFVVDHGINPEELVDINPRKLVMSANAVRKGKVDFEDAIADARPDGLSWTDYRQKYVLDVKPQKALPSPGARSRSTTTKDGTEGKSDADDGTDAVTGDKVGAANPATSANGVSGRETEDVQDDYVRGAVSVSPEPDTEPGESPAPAQNGAEASGGAATEPETPEVQPPTKAYYGQVYEELNLALASRSPNPRMSKDALSVLAVQQEVFAEFIEDFRAAPRSRHLPDKVSDLAAWVGL